MRTFYRTLSLMIVIILLSSMTFTGCTGRMSTTYKDIKNSAVADPSKEIIPDRPYLRTINENQKMNDIQEFLVSEDITIEALARKPQLEARLLSVQSLTELVHSRTEMEGLKALKAEISQALEMKSSDKFMSFNTYGLSMDQLVKLDNKLNTLFSIKTGGSAGNIASLNPLKGTWTTPDRIILRWTPQNEWIPLLGYNIFRTVNGETKKIAAGLGSQTSIAQLANNSLSFSEYIKPLYDDAWLDSDELKQLGFNTAEEFNKSVYEKAVLNAQKLRITGDLDFNLNRDRKLLIPGDISGKIPKADSYLTASVHLINEIDIVPSSLTNIRSIVSSTEKLSALAQKVKSEKESAIEQLLEARSSIVTKAFVDEEFAGASGLGYEDNLKNASIALKDFVKYTVVLAEGANASLTEAKIQSGASVEGAYMLTVQYGVETPVDTPEGLDGYGMDEVVSLRWKAPTDSYAKSIISGYYIERRKKDEADFKRINDVPVAISYTADDLGVLYETPAFYMDRELKNGEEATYRIQALDIFGRVSGYSSVLDIKVSKVAPPQVPIVGEPDLSSKVNSKKSPASYKDIISYNSKGKGVILPVTSASEDTREFVIYRSKAEGTGFFDTPVELVRINAAPYLKGNTSYVAATSSKAKFLINPKTPENVDTIYFDNTVKPGYYYKYWVSALDSWGNESAWSESKIIGCPVDTAPKDPVNTAVAMKGNDLVLDKSIIAPGFLERYTMKNAESVTGVKLPGGNSKYSLPGNPQQVGISLSDAVRQGLKTPDLLSAALVNFPNVRDIHDIVALENSDLLPDGSALVPWYHYAGEGISGYLVYRAYADGMNMDEIRAMSKEALIQSFIWDLVGSNIQTNQIKDKVEKKDGRIYIYLISLIPKEKKETGLDGFDSYIPAGWIRVSWERPQDVQVSYYRVYRAEVPYFKDNEDLKKLDWIMVVDNLKYTAYSEKVDQTYAHYYYYKVMAVSTWGVESEAGSIVKYRIPSTIPPQAPAMLVPFSKKEVNEVRWVGVPHACKYVIYRKLIPRPKEEDMEEIKLAAPDLFKTVFDTDIATGIYNVNPSKANIDPGLKYNSINGAGVTQKELISRGTASASRDSSVISAVSVLGAAASGSMPAGSKFTGTATAAQTAKFRSLQLKNTTAVRKNIANTGLGGKLQVYSNLVKKYGPLVVTPYSQLEYSIAEQVLWEKLGEIEIPLGEDSTGEKNFFDKTAIFGETYYYTVQAWNDDNLGSNRPDPVTVFTRKGKAFPPVTNVRWQKSDNKPLIQWDPAKDPNLTVKESREYIAGYLVFRSNTEAGDYYQASGLIPNDTNSFKDVNANLTSENWYKIKVVDTAGFMSDFSGAVMARTEPLNILPGGSFRSIPQISRSQAERPSSGSKSGVLSDPLFASIVIRPTPTPTPTPIIILPRVTPSIPILTPTPTPTPTPTTPPRTTPTPTPTPTPIIILPRVTPSIPILTPTPTPTSPVRPTPTPTPTPTPNIILPRVTPSVPVVTPTPTPTPGARINAISKTMTLNGFTITDISIAGKKSGSGEGMLNVQGGYQIPVNVTIKAFDGNVITDGYATQKTAVSLGDTGIFIKEADLRTDTGKSLVTGYIRKSSGNVMGDMLILDMSDSPITPNGIIHIFNIPVFHYQNLTFTGIGRISVNLNQYGNTGAPSVQGGSNSSFSTIYTLTTGSSFINLHEGTVETSMSLETVDNKGLEFGFTLAGFDAQGRLSGSFSLNGSQYMRTVIPAGLGIRAQNASLVYLDGSIVSLKSFINGRVLLPFATFEDDPVSGGQMMKLSELGNVSAQNIENLTKAIANSGNLSAQEVNLLDNSLYYMADIAQSNALLVAPDPKDESIPWSNVPFSVSNWDGKGFVIQDTTMTPVKVGKSPLSSIIGNFKSGVGNSPDNPDDSIGATPGKVALDLARDAAYAGEAPEDVVKPDWMGIVIKNGNVSLPEAYIKTEANTRVRFNLTPGELLYDLNGFFYQNQAYTPEGVPVNFGEALGGFEDVIVYNIVIDLYGNHTNLQIDGDMAVPLFNSRVKVKLYTDKNSKLVCTVSETEKLDPSGKGTVKVKILNGFLDKNGLHVDGTLDFAMEKSITFSDIQFNELVIPADMTKIAKEDENSIYGRALLDKPYLINFHDFPMEIRAVTMYSDMVYGMVKKNSYTGPKYDTTMTFWGGMQLSDNLSADANEDTDRIVINKICTDPTIVYDNSKSKVEMDFEDFAQIEGVGTPKVADEGEGLVEYDTDGMEMLFNGALDAFKYMPIKVNTRIGYDRKMGRSFFAVAIFYGQDEGDSERPAGIPLGCYGEINDMTGMIGYNLDMEKNEDGTYHFSSQKTSLFNSIDTMKVNRTPGGNYFFAISATMYIKYGELKLGQVRNMYLIVEKGPTVELGGFYYGPTTIDALVTGDESKLDEMGVVRMGYYHKDRLFKFSLSLNDAGMYGITVNGDMGFDMCPDYWELRMGYPKALQANVSNYASVWFGLIIRSSSIDESFIKAQTGFSFDTGDVTLGIVFLRAYLAVGGEGYYNFDSGSLYLHVFLRGGVEGGVKAMGKRFRVINLMLEADGTLQKSSSWKLDASARIYYHVDLWLTDIGGSVGWGISTTF